MTVIEVWNDDDTSSWIDFILTEEEWNQFRDLVSAHFIQLKRYRQSLSESDGTIST